MTKPERNPNDQIRMTEQRTRRDDGVVFELRASTFIRHSSFVIFRDKKATGEDRLWLSDSVPLSPGPRCRRWLRPGNLPWLPCIALLLRANSVGYRRRNSRRRRCV